MSTVKLIAVLLLALMLIALALKISALTSFSIKAFATLSNFYFGAGIDNLSIWFITIVLCLFNFWIFCLFALKSLLLNGLIYYKLDIEREDCIDELEDEIEQAGTLERQASKRDYFEFINLKLKTIGFAATFKLYLKIKFFEYTTGHELHSYFTISETNPFMAFGTPAQFEGPTDSFYSKEERFALLRSPAFQELLTRGLSTSTLDSTKQFQIFEALFDDHTQSTIATFGLFYSRLFKAAYFINAAQTASINCDFIAKATLVGTSGLGLKLRSESLLQAHASNFPTGQFASIILELLSTTERNANLRRLNNSQAEFTKISDYTLESIALRSNYRPTTIFEGVTDPFYFNSATSSVFSGFVLNAGSNQKVLLDIAEKDVESRRGGRWLYKFSFTERHSLRTIRSTAETLQHVASGFFRQEMFETNLWANAQFNSASNVEHIPYLYNMIYGMSFNEIAPYTSTKLSKLDHYFLTNFSHGSKLDHLTHSYAGFLRRLLFTTALKSSEIRQGRGATAVRPEARHDAPIQSLLQTANSAVVATSLGMFGPIGERSINDLKGQTNGKQTNFETDVQLNYEGSQFFSIFNLEDLCILLADNSTSYFSTFDYLMYTQNVRSTKSDLFEIDYESEGSTNFQDFSIFSNYYPQHILAKDIEQYLNHFGLK